MLSKLSKEQSLYVTLIEESAEILLELKNDKVNFDNFNHEYNDFIAVARMCGFQTKEKSEKIMYSIKAVETELTELIQILCKTLRFGEKSINPLIMTEENIIVVGRMIMNIVNMNVFLEKDIIEPKIDEMLITAKKAKVTKYI